MALVHSNGGHSTSNNPTQPLQSALDAFRTALPANERTAFDQQNQRPDAEDVFAFVTRIDIQNQHHKRRCVTTRLCTFLLAVQDFTSVIDTFVSANPKYAALVWGGIKLTLQLAGNVVFYFYSIFTP